MENVGLSVLVGMEPSEPREQLVDLRHVIWPGRDMHFAIAFDNTIKVTLAYKSKVSGG